MQQKSWVILSMIPILFRPSFAQCSYVQDPALLADDMREFLLMLEELGCPCSFNAPNFYVRETPKASLSKQVASDMELADLPDPRMQETLAL